MKTRTKISCCVLLFICFVFHGFALAQPDAGSILRDQSQPESRLPDRMPLEMEKEGETPPGSGSLTAVLINGFLFTGYEGIASEAELQGLVKDYIGRELDISGLRQITTMVTCYLRDEKGYFLARAYLPEQDITEGIITIAIISGKIDGKAGINIREPSRINPSLLQGIADRALPEGSPARMQDMERAVLLMKDLPEIEAEASIEPGETPGSSRVIVNVFEGPLFNGYISGDNYGDRYTGIYRGTGSFSLSDPSGFGDEVSLTLREADRLDLWRIGYSIPLSSTGLSLNSSYTDLHYKVGKDLAALEARGWARALAVDLRYPIVLSRNTDIRAGIGYDRLLLEDEANQQKTSDRDVQEGAIFVRGRLLDSFWGGGQTSAYFVLAEGDVDLSGLPSHKAIDDAGARTSGDYSRGIYYMSRLQRVTRLVSLFASARGQFASGNLDSSRKFILGGPTGVRAYPVGEAAGDEGHIFTFEARVDLPFIPSPASTQLTGFFDAARIRLHKDPWVGSVTNISDRNSYSLKGAGMGVNVSSEDVYELSATYAREIGDNDGASVNGTDADNLDNDDRFWLNLTIRF